MACAYCGSQRSGVKSIFTVNRYSRRYIYYCSNHEEQAEHDIVRQLRDLDMYRQSDVLKEPIFALLPEKLDNWHLYKSDNGDYAEFVGRFEHDTTIWGIGLIEQETGLQMSVPISWLKQFLPLEHQGLTEALIRRLDSGLYA